MTPKKAAPFFNYARKRHQIYLDRKAGLPAPWTDDRVLRANRFTNVFRELDTVTLWYAANIRRPLQHKRWVLPATVIFRWFNRVTSGQILLDPLVGLLDGKFDAVMFENLMRTQLPKGPWVTGSYMVFSGKNNGDKLTGLLSFIDGFLRWWYETGRDRFKDHNPSMRHAHEWLQEVDGLSGFTAYEIVSDIRYTDVVSSVDACSWAHVGPGATRGMSRLLHGRDYHLRQESSTDQAIMLKQMKDLLEKSRDPEFWPQTDLDWPAWEMREVEHTLCEFDKYERVRRGEGQTKRIFNDLAAGPLQEF